MKINGLKHLNNNWYDSIMIRNTDSNETKINIKNKDNINSIYNSSFSDSIKYLSEKDKINEIIRYYLRNNKIYSINDKTKLEYYDGYFIAIEGTRNLYLQLKDNSIDKEVLEEIKEKYISDRYEYLYNLDIKNIDFSYFIDESSYYVSKYRNEVEDVLNIQLKSNDNKVLSKFEKDFLLDYIKYLFSKTDQKIYERHVGISIYMYKYYDTLKFGEFPGIYIGNKDFILKINYSIFKEIDGLIYRHNKNIEDSKKMQLSLLKKNS
ncbi:MAG: hypothetical protein IJD92_02830 [Bacilli bacterium]|nr:hypothetical protein [Bacilli bacterium]